MTIAPHAEQERADATRQLDSIVDLAQHLVRHPSRGGLDDGAAVVQIAASWLQSAGLDVDILRDHADRPAAVVCDVDGSTPGPHYVLDACLDTADVGDPTAWRRDPFSGDVQAGWLYGRGSSDSKTAVAVFAHLVADLAQRADFSGRVTVLYDLDEHTGGFAGIRRYLDGLDRLPNGVMIGYPGSERIIVGGRGFFRAAVVVHGRAEHTASRRGGPSNALTRAAELIRLLDGSVPFDADPALGLPPKLTVTSIHGGTSGSYSVVPDRCELEVDIRLTPAFTAARAEALVKTALATLDRSSPAPRPSTWSRAAEPWPAFRLPDGHPLPAALLAGAHAAGLSPALAVAGPSNIGCFLAVHGVPTTAGFGVTYRGLHAADEAVEIASIPAVYVAYREALRLLLVDPAGPGI